PRRTPTASLVRTTAVPSSSRGIGTHSSAPAPNTRCPCGGDRFAGHGEAHQVGAVGLQDEALCRLLLLAGLQCQRSWWPHTQLPYPPEFPEYGRPLPGTNCSLNAAGHTPISLENRVVR